MPEATLPAPAEHGTAPAPAARAADIIVRDQRLPRLVLRFAFNAPHAERLILNLAEVAYAYLDRDGNYGPQRDFVPWIQDRHFENPHTKCTLEDEWRAFFGGFFNATWPNFVFVHLATPASSKHPEKAYYLLERGDLDQLDIPLAWRTSVN